MATKSKRTYAYKDNKQRAEEIAAARKWLMSTTGNAAERLKSLEQEQLSSGTVKYIRSILKR